MIEDVVARHVLGSDPFRIEALWRDVYASGYTLRPDVSLMGVLSRIEIALWDIIGKAVDKPVYELLGGRVHERLRSYTYLYPEPARSRTNDLLDPDLAAQRAAEYVEHGLHRPSSSIPPAPYSAFDPRQPSLESLDLCDEFVQAIREAVGTKADLLFGTHGQFTASGAIRLAKRLEPYDPLWFEEPTPPEKPEEMARGRARDLDPDRHRRAADHQIRVRPRARSRAASILQMALGRVGGLLEAKKIAGMAEAHYAQIAPHLYCGPVEGAANIQLGALLPNFLILESIETWGGFHAEILKKPIALGGRATSSRRPSPASASNSTKRSRWPSLYRQEAASRDDRPAGRADGAPAHALRLHRPRPSRRHLAASLAARRLPADGP